MPSMWNYEDFKRFRDEVVPDLKAAGWSVDKEGPRIPNPFVRLLPPIRICYRNPGDGLYYGLKDAVRVAVGERPRCAGVPKLTERQKDAILRYLYDPENASSVVEDCPEFSGDKDSFSAYRQAVENFIEKMREDIGR